MQTSVSAFFEVKTVLKPSGQLTLTQYTEYGRINKNYYYEQNHCFIKYNQFKETPSINEA
jgi:hypothetical protein